MRFIYISVCVLRNLKSGFSISNSIRVLVGWFSNYFMSWWWFLVCYDDDENCNWKKIYFTRSSLALAEENDHLIKILSYELELLFFFFSDSVRAAFEWLVMCFCLGQLVSDHRKSGDRISSISFGLLGISKVRFVVKPRAHACWKVSNFWIV